MLATHKSVELPSASHQAPQEMQCPVSSAASANTLSLNPESEQYTLAACLPYSPSAVRQQLLTCQAILRNPFLLKQPHTLTQALQQFAPTVGWHRSFVSGTIAIFCSVWVQFYTSVKTPAHRGFLIHAAAVVHSLHVYMILVKQVSDATGPWTHEHY